jgi:hypothetical protein
LLAHGRWFSPGTPASSTTKTGRHDIAEILLNTINQIFQIVVPHLFFYHILTFSCKTVQANGAKLGSNDP